MPTPPLPIDYHSHHHRCGHAAGEIEDYLQEAIERGLTHFGVSDHGPAYWFDQDHALPSTQMPMSEFGAYVREAQAQKARFAGRLEVAVGVEADYIEGREEDLARLLAAQPLDYVLGSVHYAAGASIFKKERWRADDPEAVYTEYYRLVVRAAATGLFDILSHLTAVEAYGPPIDEALAETLYPQVADAVAASGCAVEINTSGYRKMGGDEPFPNRTMLRHLIARGVPLTFGSDCHRPGEVAYAQARVRDLLQELGVGLDAGPQPAPGRRGPLLVYVTQRSA